MELKQISHCIEDRLVVSNRDGEWVFIRATRFIDGRDECLVAPLSTGDAVWQPAEVLDGAVALDHCYVPWMVAPAA